MARKDKPKKCLIKTCGRPAEKRGLCESCYQQAAYKIRQKQTTDAYLVGRGLMLPRFRGAFAAAFAEKKS